MDEPRYRRFTRSRARRRTADPMVMQRPCQYPRKYLRSRLGSYMVRIGIIFGVLSIAMMKWAYDYTHAPLYRKPQRVENDGIYNPLSRPDGVTPRRAIE